MKNVLVFALNGMKDDSNDWYEFTDENNEFHANVKYINEVAVRYLIYKFEKENKTLDYMFVFLKQEDLDNGNYEKFKQIFPAIPTDFAVISSGFVKENLAVAPEMCEKIIEYKNNVDEDINVSFDLAFNFNYNSVIMPLIKLVKYNNLNIDYVLYANTSVYPNVIEEASDFVNLPTLINGAEEFISRGSADKIQDYFSSRQPNEDIKNTLNKMMALSDTLRICGSYEATKNALVELNKAIKNYELSMDNRLKNLLDKTNELSNNLKECRSYEDANEILEKLNSSIAEYKEALNKKEKVNLNEFYFNKLMPKIKFEYEDILPDNKKKSAPIDIIRWCLKTGMLHQAIIFFTEWIPDFLVNEKYLTVDEEIKAECEKKGQQYSSWAVYFFRAYQVKNQTSALSYVALKQIFKDKQKNLSNIMKAVKGKNEKLDNFLKTLHDFCKSKNGIWANKILSLPQNHPVRHLITIQHKQVSFEEFVKKMYNNEKDIEQKLANIFCSMPRNNFKNLFDICDNGLDSINSNSTRAEIMKYLLDNNLITVKQPSENFLNFIDIYNLIVQYFRNKMAHAVVNDKVILKQDKLAQIIENSLDLIEKKE